MATKNTELYKMDLATAVPKDLYAMDVSTAVPKAAVPKAAVPKAGYADPSAITPSYYTNPSDASNAAQNRPVYAQSDAVTDASNQLNQHQQNKPGEYQSQYGDQIQNMIDSLLNRDKFNYDFSTDPLYQQYAERYQQQGRMAMKDSMAESAALTGGYGNSYAQQVGQQTYQTYLQGLNDKLPELRDAAYQMYVNEGDTMRGNLGMLQTQDAADYGRYRDGVGDWQNERDYLYSLYNDMSANEYNRFQNDSARWESDREYWNQIAQQQQAQANWQAEFNLALKNARRSGGGGSGSKTGGGDAEASAAPENTGSTAANPNRLHHIAGGVSTAGYQAWKEAQKKKK